MPVQGRLLAIAHYGGQHARVAWRSEEQERQREGEGDVVLQTLRKSLEAREVIAVVGAGVSAAATLVWNASVWPLVVHSLTTVHRTPRRPHGKACCSGV